MGTESNASALRIHKNKGFTVMSNHHLRNSDLSLKAVGLMSKILSLPEDWNYSIAGLVKICKEGETAVHAALHKLIDNKCMVTRNRKQYLSLTVSRTAKRTAVDTLQANPCH